MESAQHLFDLAQAKIPARLRPYVENQWRALRDRLRELPPAGIEKWVPMLPRVFAASEFAARTCAQHPAVLRELVSGGELFRAYRAGEIAHRVSRATADAPDEAALKARLRAARQREMLRIAFRDLAGWADLGEVAAAATELADACLEAASERLYTWAVARHGRPLGESGRTPVGLVVLGLGKLGGRELNFSSDIDLVFAYAEDGETRGDGASAQALSNHEFFVRLCQRLIGVLSETTTDGFVFRVDARLRPFGASGPLALSFDAMEQYYQAHGRDWERYALIKARVAAGDRAAGAELVERLKPFVYRRYLDYGAFEAIRSMKAMIAREVSRKGLQDDIKLGWGGIREIEFLVQTLQMIRGGREPALQEPNLLTALVRLAARGYVDAAARAELAAAYVFLRNVEHRLQMVNDAQTQTLPRDALERERIAFACGYDDWATFERALTGQRTTVQRHFSHVLSGAGDSSAAAGGGGLAGVWLGIEDAEAAQGALRAAGYRDTAYVTALLEALREGSTYGSFSAEGRSRMDRLVPLLLAAAGASADPDITLARLIRLLEAIGRRSSYLALLIENAQVLAQLVNLCAASPWIATWIAQHPILLDELLDPRALYELPERAELEAELAERLQALEGNLEVQMERLREFRNAHLLHVAAADIGPGLAPDQVGAYLSQLADVLLSACLELAYAMLVERHGPPGGDARCAEPGFAVVGYGKLGSLELGYASDLDMIFLYDDVEGGVTRGPRVIPNELLFARLGQRLIHLLTTRTPAGILYEVDMRLRPSGNAGPLVTSLAAFTRYQQTQAWTWEHQALVRARPVAGKPALRAAFEEARRAVLCRPRDEAVLRRDVREMRRRMAATHAADLEEFDVKHGRGGIVDIEFMVQYWVMRWASAHPDVARPTDNIHILETLAGRGLIPAAWAVLLTDGYRRYLSIEQRLKLMERGTRVPHAELGDLPQAVLTIWNEVLERE